MNMINKWMNRSWLCGVCGNRITAAKNKRNQYKARCRNCGAVTIRDADGMFPDRIYPQKKREYNKEA